MEIRNRLETPEADVIIHYLEHFPKRPISQFPNDLPYLLWVNVPVYVFVLLLLLIRPQLEYLPKIEERHLFGRELTVLWMRSLRLFPPRKKKKAAVPPDAELKWLSK